MLKIFCNFVSKSRDMKNLLVFMLLLPSVVSTTKTEKELPKDYVMIYESFKNYNPEIDSTSVMNFTKVINHFKLNEDKVELKYLLGQILLESGAKHRYPKRYKKRHGKLVVSSTGAIGFSQILGSTALDCMVRLMDDFDKKEFILLGASDFNFAYDKTKGKWLRVKLAKDWLGNERNNMIMWGYIMNRNLGKRKIISALVGYNIGNGGLRKYLRNGNNPSQHHYIKGIRKRFKHITF
jgi:hypothetical protein